ncbi:MAG: hypothetical protein QM698_15245 [Micropepsaceae bacterium]
MKRMMMAVAGAAILALAGCGDSGSAETAHAVCKKGDIDATAAYVEKAFADISQAVIEGKITAEQAQQAAEKLAKANSEANASEKGEGKGPGWYCTQIDAVKKELGI